jgi:galactose mutarotase-like enzyme
MTGVRAVERPFRGTPAVEIGAGPTSAVFAPDVGMTGVSFEHDGVEHLALPGGLDALRNGSTAGLPLLAPWANRLARRGYTAAGVDVDLTQADLGVDEHGLPIHGLLVGRPGWSVDRLTARAGSARVHASLDVDSPAFPFPHRIEITAVVRESQLRVDTTVVPTGDRAVPISFGWHPYLRLAGEPRPRWRLRLPARRHLALDDRGIPTGDSAAEVAEAEPIGRRTFDDAYALGRDRRLAVVSGSGRSVEVRCGTGYPFAQVWVPSGKPFVALEPMTASTNALVDGTARTVAPGDSYSATFSITSH